MGRLIYAMNTSLDGYVADRDGDFQWSPPSAELLAAITELQRRAGTYLYGRRLYEMMAVWQTLHLDPGDAPFMPGLRELERTFAEVWRGADKVVFSTTSPGVSTPRTRLERAFDPDAIRRLKATSERDLMVGGPHLAAAMLTAGLVDEVHAFVHPVIVGGGTPFLPHDLRLPLELAGVSRLGCVVHLHHQSQATA